MASRAAIATMNDLAFKRLYRAMADISEAFPEVETAILPSYRDIRYQEAARYDALATWAERLALAMGVSSVPVIEEVPLVTEDETEDTPEDDNSDYNSFTAKELRAEADARGIDTKAFRTKDEVIDALEAADGMTEDEQQAAHEDGEAS